MNRSRKTKQRQWPKNFFCVLSRMNRQKSHWPLTEVFEMVDSNRFDMLMNIIPLKVLFNNCTLYVEQWMLSVSVYAPLFAINSQILKHKETVTVKHFKTVNSNRLVFSIWQMMTICIALLRLHTSFFRFFSWRNNTFFLWHVTHAMNKS